MGGKECRGGEFFSFSLGAGWVWIPGQQKVWDLRDFPSIPLSIPLVFPLPDPRGRIFPRSAPCVWELRCPEVTPSLDTFEDVGQSHPDPA